MHVKLLHPKNVARQHQRTKYFCFAVSDSVLGYFFLAHSTALNGLVIFDVSDFINSFCFPISEFQVLTIAYTNDFFPVSAKALYSGGHDSCEQEADFISD